MMKLSPWLIMPALPDPHHDLGERLGAVMAIEIPVPLGEQLLGVRDLLIALRVGAGEVAEPFRAPAELADAGVELDPVQVVGADPRVRAYQFARTGAAVGGVGLDPEQRVLRRDLRSRAGRLIGR